MKKQLVFSVVSGVLLSIMTISTASAQEFVPQHELRLSVGWVPSGMGHDYYHSDHTDNPTIRQGATYVSGAWSVSYGYRFTKWFDLSGAVSYFGEYSAYYSNLDNSKVYPDNSHEISVMPMARFTWLNRPWVRMYGSLGISVQYRIEKKRHTETELYIAGQITPIGIAVGKSLFGFAELGVGTQGFAVVGIGYRFNDKKHTK